MQSSDLYKCPLINVKLGTSDTLGFDVAARKFFSLIKAAFFKRNTVTRVKSDWEIKAKANSVCNFIHKRTRAALVESLEPWRGKVFHHQKHIVTQESAIVFKALALIAHRERSITFSINKGSKALCKSWRHGRQGERWQSHSQTQNIPFAFASKKCYILFAIILISTQSANQSKVTTVCCKHQRIQLWIRKLNSTECFSVPMTKVCDPFDARKVAQSYQSEERKKLSFYCSTVRLLQQLSFGWLRSGRKGSRVINDNRK